MLGGVLLLFVAYQLWGTSLQYARAQSGLRDDFSEILSQTASFRNGADGTVGLGSSTETVASSGSSSGIAILSSDATAEDASNGIASLSSATATLSDGTATLSAGTATPSGLEAEAGISETRTPEALQPASASTEIPQGAATQPSASPSASPAETTRETLLVSPSTRLPREEIENANLVYTPGSEEILPLLYPEGGEAVARIVIPAIKMDKIVVEGTDVDALRKGPGHYSWTPMPGQPGNASIAGHRTTYGAPFANIGNLRPGDRITVQTAQGEFIYEVLAQDSPTKGYLIVSPDRVDLLRDKGSNLLTLTSCHPRFSNRQRIVVQAKLLGDPVVPMRDVNTRQDAPLQLASEDLTGVAGAERSAASESNALQAGNAAGVAGAGEAGATDSATAENTASGEAGASGNANSSGLTSTQQAGSAAGQEGTAGQTQAGAVAGDSETSDSAAASRDALSASSGSASQPAVGTSFGSGLSGERSAIPSAALWFVATAILWGAVWLVGTRWRRWPSTAIGILPVLGCLFVAFSYIDRALPSY